MLGWAGIALVVWMVLAVIWVFRQNPPTQPADAAENKVMWTSGKIAEGPLEVEGKGHLTFPVNLNKRSTLSAFFTTGDNARKLTFSILAAADLEKWKAGERVRLLTNTGPVPRGTVERVLEPGDYVVVLDNRPNEQPILITDSKIEVE